MSDQIAKLVNRRVKVMILYPDSVFNVGTILHYSETGHGDFYSDTEINFSPYNDNYVSAYVVHRCKEIFRSLNWYEDRVLEEMPDYVISMKNQKVYRVSQYRKDLTVAYSKDDHAPDSGLIPLKNTSPATEEDYQQYLKSK